MINVFLLRVVFVIVIIEEQTLHMILKFHT